MINKTETFRILNEEEKDMPLVTSEKMLLDAQNGGYAVGDRKSVV